MPRTSTSGIATPRNATISGPATIDVATAVAAMATSSTIAKADPRRVAAPVDAARPGAHEAEAAQRERRDAGHEEHDDLDRGVAEERRPPRVRDHPADQGGDRDPRRPDGEDGGDRAPGRAAGARTGSPRMNAMPATQPPGFTARASPMPPIPDVAEDRADLGRRQPPDRARRRRRGRPRGSARRRPPAGRATGLRPRRRRRMRAASAGCRRSARGGRRPGGAPRGWRSTPPRRAARGRSG